MKINRRVVHFLGKDLVGVRVAFLPNYPLILSLLKHRGVETFLNLKIRNPNRGNPLNNSIEKSKKCLFSPQTLTSPSPQPKTHNFLPPKSKPKTQILRVKVIG